jgi:hypothetical protein
MLVRSECVVEERECGRRVPRYKSSEARSLDRLGTRQKLLSRDEW